MSACVRSSQYSVATKAHCAAPSCKFLVEVSTECVRLGSTSPNSQLIVVFSSCDPYYTYAMLHEKPVVTYRSLCPSRTVPGPPNCVPRWFSRDARPKNAKFMLTNILPVTKPIIIPRNKICLCLLLSSNKFGNWKTLAYYIRTYNLLT